MVYTGAKLQGGAVSNAQMLDLAIASIAISGAATTILPPDYKSLGVAAIGAVIGGLVAARMFRNEQREPLEWMWALSSMMGIAVAPATFDWMSTPRIVEGAVMAAPMIDRTANNLLALSFTISMVSWGTAKVLHKGWIEVVRKWLDGLKGWVSRFWGNK